MRSIARRATGSPTSASRISASNRSRFSGSNSAGGISLPASRRASTVSGAPGALTSLTTTRPVPVGRSSITVPLVATRASTRPSSGSSSRTWCPWATHTPPRWKVALVVVPLVGANDVRQATRPSFSNAVTVFASTANERRLAAGAWSGPAGATSGAMAGGASGRVGGVPAAGSPAVTVTVKRASMSGPSSHTMCRPACRSVMSTPRRPPTAVATVIVSLPSGASTRTAWSTSLSPVASRVTRSPGAGRSGATSATCGPRRAPWVCATAPVASSARSTNANASAERGTVAIMGPTLPLDLTAGRRWGHGRPSLTRQRRRGRRCAKC